MVRRYILLLLISSSIGIFGQNSVTGFVNMEDEYLATEVQLSKINIEDYPDFSVARKIGSYTLDKNGFFKFKRTVISNKDAIYRLHIKHFEKTLKDTLDVAKLFVLSNRDTIHFKKSKIPFAAYTSSSMADKEWQKLRSFEEQLRKNEVEKQDSLSEDYVINLKTYTKDSLEILMVKLIGIKQLDNKELLEKDIAKNPNYYLALLAELKDSDIERSEYLFLENKLAFLTTEIAESKYLTSLTINLLLGLFVLALIVFVFRKQRKNQKVSLNHLSKQEKNIQTLILEGKTNKEIANELFISISTVKTHITNIYSKLDVSNRQELLKRTQN